MLLIETIVDGDELFYCVIPVVNGFACPYTEFVFDNEEDQAEFIDLYFANPLAAKFAYHVTMEEEYGQIL